MLGIDLITLPKQIVVRSCLYNVNTISFYVTVTLPGGFEPLCPERKIRNLYSFAATAQVPNSLA